MLGIDYNNHRLIFSSFLVLSFLCHMLVQKPKDGIQFAAMLCSVGMALAFKRASN